MILLLVWNFSEDEFLEEFVLHEQELCYIFNKIIVNYLLFLEKTLKKNLFCRCCRPKGQEVSWGSNKACLYLCISFKKEKNSCHEKSRFKLECWYPPTGILRQNDWDLGKYIANYYTSLLSLYDMLYSFLLYLIELVFKKNMRHNQRKTKI